MTPAPDGTAFTVNYWDYVARAGLGASPVDFRKHCQLSLAVHGPDGFTYAITREELRGYASVVAGAIAMLRTDTHFQGFASDWQTHPFTAPFEDYWEIEPSTAPVHNPCGDLRNLSVNTELRVTVGTSDPTTTGSVLAMDSPIGTTFHVVWQRCPDGR